MLKRELRKKYKDLRFQLTDNKLEEESLAIANQLVKMDIWDKTYYHLFLPIEEQKEVNSEFVLNVLQAKDKEIVISKSDFATTSMSHFLLTDNTRIKKNEYNIPEPINGLNVPIDMIDVVFVPLLAYDKLGSRVGYGKGFYDKFLSECKPDVIKIGLSFFEPEKLIEDVFENDVKLDFCVSPNNILKFKF
jgi:5-formyltetrahydrofolate cyclo-ligase